MTVLVHISDPHFGTERPPVVEALVAFVQRTAPALVVLSGDITQRATRSQFAAARAFADRLAPWPLLAIAGNHDIPLFNLPARLTAPYANFARAFGDAMEPVHRAPQWLVVGVKTTRRWRHKHGEVSDAQIARVADQLRTARAEQVRVVVVHQPVAVPEGGGRANLLRGHERAVRCWSAAGADVIAGGHIHLPCVVPLHERHAGLARRAWCVQAGTAVSSRVRDEAGNSVNLLRHEGGGGAARRCVVERWDYVPGREAFVQVDRHALALDAAGPGATGSG